MKHYIALIHKDHGGCYGVSFPDVPGVITAGDTLDEALREAGEVLAFAAEGWPDSTGAAFPQPRSFEALRSDPEFVAASADAVVAAVPLKQTVEEAA
jgi:antitoxin HicB